MANSKSQKPVLLLDTNIIMLASGFKPLLDDLINAEFRLNVSTLTIYELANRKTAKTYARYREVLQNFGRFDFTETDAEFAGTLERIYGTEVGDRRLRDISDIDKMLAATSVRRGAMLVTTDRNDFPATFFKTIYVDSRGPQKVYVIHGKQELVDRYAGWLAGNEKKKSSN